MFSDMNQACIKEHVSNKCPLQDVLVLNAQPNQNGCHWGQQMHVWLGPLNLSSMQKTYNLRTPEGSCYNMPTLADCCLRKSDFTLE
eukprot:scaffold442996_cov20-Prasinocladus_malaysianus.AAC.1